MNTKIIFIVLFLIVFSATQAEASVFRDTRENYEKTGNVIWEVNTKEKIVALTFDDGPHPIFTPQILDLLAKYKAKATFFAAGNKVERFPEVLKRVAKEGHEIANHTYSHIYSSRIPAEKLTEELQKTDSIIKNITGQQPTLYRPVGGMHNDVIIDTAIKNGKTVILWSWHMDSKDWSRPPAGKMSKQIITGVKPGNIILFHDWIGSEYTETSQTVVALEDILKYLIKNGYECVTVSEMMYRSSNTLPEPIDPYNLNKKQTGL